jgi:hypothetical protein
MKGKAFAWFKKFVILFLVHTVQNQDLIYHGAPDMVPKSIREKERSELQLNLKRGPWTGLS